MTKDNLKPKVKDTKAATVDLEVQTSKEIKASMVAMVAKICKESMVTKGDMEVDLTKFTKKAKPYEEDSSQEI